MYFNNIHILLYVAIAFIGLIAGRVVAWLNLRLPKHQKIIGKEFFTLTSNELKGEYIFMFIMSIIYIFLLYHFKLNSILIKNIDLIKYMVLTPMLVSAFCVDIKYRILPNRLTLLMFEIGLIFAFVYGISNINMAKEYIFGAVVGGIVFGAITLLGYLLSGKEAMGLGDVKFITSVMLFFGISYAVDIILLSFVIATVISIILLIVRAIKHDKDEYMSFGPSMACACLTCIFIPSGIIMNYFIYLCGMIADKF